MNIKMEKMAIGNMMYAEVAEKKYVGADREWCEVQFEEKDGKKDTKYVVLNDASLLSRLYARYVELKFKDSLDGFVKQHLRTKGGA